MTTVRNRLMPTDCSRSRRRNTNRALTPWRSTPMRKRQADLNPPGTSAALVIRDVVQRITNAALVPGGFKSACRFRIGVDRQGVRALFVFRLRDLEQSVGISRFRTVVIQPLQTLPV